MTEQPYEVLPPEDMRPLAWHQVWIKAITQPSENTFLELLEREPDPSAAKAFGWVALATFIGGVVMFILALLFNLFGFGLLSGEDILPGLGGSALALICVVPFAIIIGVIGFALYSALIQVVARILGGVGTYGEMAYTFAAYGAPLSLISLIVTPIPFIGWCLAPLITIYGVVLNVMAVKASHRFDWGRAIITSLSLVIIGALFACCIFFLVSAGLIAAAPAIEDLFPEIIRELSTGPF